MYSCEIIKKSIEDSIEDSEAIITNPRGDNEHFFAEVISKSFEGKTPIQRHRMVYDALKKEFDAGLHSLSLQTKTEK